MPAAGRLVSQGWYDVGRFLSHSIPGYYARYPISRGDFWHDAGISSFGCSG